MSSPNIFTSAAVTLDIYAGLFGDDLDAVAERLDASRAISRTERGPNVVPLERAQRRNVG